MFYALSNLIISNFLFPLRVSNHRWREICAKHKASAFDMLPKDNCASNLCSFRSNSLPPLSHSIALGSSPKMRSALRWPCLHELKCIINFIITFNVLTFSLDFYPPFPPSSYTTHHTAAQVVCVHLTFSSLVYFPISFLFSATPLWALSNSLAVAVVTVVCIAANIMQIPVVAVVWRRKYCTVA